MRKLVFTCLITGMTLVSGYAQPLFTYGSHSVQKDDFLRVYKKNSLKNKPDLSDTALRGYLELYSLFRMKVSEAEKEHLDTMDKIQKDLDSYRKQLAKNYLTDDQMTAKLIREAYDRMKENVHVEHILLTCTPGTDTVFAYRKIDSIYNQILSKKVTFEEMAKLYSDDKGTKDNGGDVGYISGLQTVYAFENMVYGTPVGKISKPFKTQFGYHIVKVLDKRQDKGTVKVAQILLTTPKSKGEDGVNAARMRADSIEAMLKGGTPFYELVKKYSEDKYSVNDSGNLKPFGSGKMIMAFENAAFGLKKPGEVSAPIKTDYGFHIIKLISKTPLAPYDSMFQQLKRRVENDSRAQTAREHYFNKIKEKNGYKEYPENFDEISNLLIKSISDTGKIKGTFRGSDFYSNHKPLFAMGGTTYLQSDFIKFFEGLTHGRVTGNRNAAVRDAYGVYQNNVLTDFQERKLEKENPEFRNLMEEYKDGIMLFELMDRNVWSKASKDSVGLKAFYETKKSKYLWEPGFEGSVYTFKNKAAYDTGMVMLADSKITDEDIIKALNTQTTPDRVTIQRGRYEFSKFKDATQGELTANHKKTIPMPNGTYKLVSAREVFSQQAVKTLEEARGYVVAEYQDFLEKQWNEKMRHDFPMKLNETVFKSMVKK